MPKYQNARAIAYTLKSKECSGLAVSALNRHIDIPINGKLNKKTVFQGLIGMSINRLSIHPSIHPSIL